MHQQPLVGIIGAGEIGRALGGLLESNNLSVTYGDIQPSSVVTEEKTAAWIPTIDVLFFCVPSSALREAVAAVMPYLAPKTIVVSLAKGIEKKSHATMDEVLENLLPTHHNVALLGGPMLAEELFQGKGGVATIGAADKEVAAYVGALFIGTPVIAEYSDDPHGVAVCGVLKNIYAIALGIADGLGWGGNRKGYLTATALQEMAEITTFLNGNAATAYGSAGLGDLLATGYSVFSHNHLAGEELARNHRFITSEGAQALTPLLSLLKQKKNAFKVLHALERTLLKKENPQTVFNGFFA